MYYANLISRHHIKVDRAVIASGDLVEEFLCYVQHAIQKMESRIDPSDRVVIERYVKLCVLAKLRVRIVRTSVPGRVPLLSARRELQWALALCGIANAQGRNCATLRFNDIENAARDIANPYALRAFHRWLVENRICTIDFKFADRSKKYTCASDEEYAKTVDVVFNDVSVVPLRLRTFFVLAALGINTSKLAHAQVGDLQDRLLVVGEKRVALMDRIFDLVDELRDQRLLRCADLPSNFDNAYLFASGGGNVPPVPAKMTMALSRHGLRLRNFRNAATARLSHNVGELYFASQQVGLSRSTVVSIATHHKSRGASYAITLAANKRN